MGLRNQLLKVIDWEDNTRDTIAYKFPLPPKTEIMMGSQLIVRESQVAILVSSGRIADVFKPGRYKLDTGNMPILTTLMSWAYGFKSPFVCDVYYINTKQFLSQKWGTSSPVMMRDQDFGMVQFRGYGIFSYKVGDPEVFLREIMGSGASYKTADILEQLRRMIVSGVTESVADSNIPALDLAMMYSELGERTTEVLNPKFKGMGIDLINLSIENLSLTEESTKAMNERTRMNILGSSQEYTAYASADALKTMAENAHKGTGMNIGGMGMGLGTGFAMTNLYSSTIAGAQNANNEMARAKANSQREQDEYKFKKQVERDEEEAKPVYCPKCNFQNKKTAKFCLECGQKLQAVCPKCGHEILQAAKFCPECGERAQAPLRECPKCKKVCKMGVKFCPDCGTRVD